LENVSKLVGTKRYLFKNANFQIYYGAKIGIVGINGSGKSSFLKVVAGEDENHEGEVRIFPGYSVGYLAQEPELDEDLTVLENIMEGIEDKIEILDRFDELSAIAEPTKKQKNELDNLNKQITTLGIKNLKGKVSRAMEALRCPPPNSSITNLSGGEKRRVALCQILLSAPDLLILDEPTNHLDTDSVRWLENYLSTFPGTVLAVTHDRYFLDNVAAYILEIDRGEMYPFKGNYSEWLSAKARRLELEANKESALAKTISDEAKWVQQPAKARQAKGKARMNRYEEMLESAGREKYRAGSISIPPGPRLGKVVLSVENLSKAIKGRTLFSDVTFNVVPGSVVGIVGPNGSGKSTLFRILTGELQPDKGKIEFGKTVKLGYMTQGRDALDPKKTIYEEIAEGCDTVVCGANTIDMRLFVASFAFSGNDQNKSVSVLSGGERNRVHLAKMIKTAPNVLLLDEPTNDLDLEVLRKLEEAIEGFAGVAIIVSHDRWFLDRLCTHILAFEPNNVHYFSGNYSDYLIDRKERLGAEKAKQFTKLGV